MFVIDFKEIDETYLQIVAGRFPLNKELAFELAALMAQVQTIDHHRLSSIIIGIKRWSSMSHEFLSL